MITRPAPWSPDRPPGRQMTPFLQSCCFVRAKPLLLQSLTRKAKPGRAKADTAQKKKWCFVQAKRYISRKHVVSPTRNTYLKKRQHQALASPSILNLGGQEKNASRAGKMRVFFDFGVLACGAPRQKVIPCTPNDTCSKK